MSQIPNRRAIQSLLEAGIINLEGSLSLAAGLGLESVSGALRVDLGDGLQFAGNAVGVSVASPLELSGGSVGLTLAAEGGLQDGASGLAVDASVDLFAAYLASNGASISSTAWTDIEFDTLIETGPSFSFTAPSAAITLDKGFYEFHYSMSIEATVTAAHKGWGLRLAYNTGGGDNLIPGTVSHIYSRHTDPTGGGSAASVCLPFEVAADGTVVKLQMQSLTGTGPEVQPRANATSIYIKKLRSVT